jgi:hypothetical protein
MEWGMIMAMVSVDGMLVLIFAQPETERYQTFGREVLNPPDNSAPSVEGSDMRKAA